MTHGLHLSEEELECVGPLYKDSYFDDFKDVNIPESAPDYFKTPANYGKQHMSML